MQDIVEPSREMSDAGRVVFATLPSKADSGSPESDRFGVEDSRIFAFFPTDHYERDAVMIKWHRSDRPQILLFERYPIKQSDGNSHVSLRPKGGWEPGQYQVNVYAADEAVTLLAQGRYSVE